MERMSRLCVEKVANGYILQGVNEYYSRYGEAEIFPTFEDAMFSVAKNFKETDFGATLKESQELSRSLAAFFGKVIKPQLMAIEAKINPGVENLVKDKKDKDDDWISL